MALRDYHSPGWRERVRVRQDGGGRRAYLNHKWKAVWKKGFRLIATADREGRGSRAEAS